ncbi:MAG: hypothetical protein Q8L23_12905 [Caulobacter sp.]|nr:hypothetical protein [Caulobacter sp.]
MKRALYILTAVTLGAAAPAAAGDMLYPGGTMLTENLEGRPYWAVQARCAGVYGATSNFLADKGDTDGAAEAKAMGVAFFNIAVDRVMKDRGIERRAALEALSPGVIAGRQETIEVLQAEGDGPSSTWNYARSVCLDIRDSYGAP